MSDPARRRLGLAWLDLGPTLSSRGAAAAAAVVEAARPDVEPADRPGDLEGRSADVPEQVLDRRDRAGEVGSALDVTAAVVERAADGDDFACADADADADGDGDGDSDSDSDADAVAAVDVDAGADADTATARGVDPEEAWALLQAEVSRCTGCGLAGSRRQTVFGVGARTAPLMIIGEAPGAEEDARGEPFVGQAGRLLDLMLAEIGLHRGRDVFICNVLKCRPPGNRNPAPDEVAACAGYLERQIRLVRPRVVLLLGSFAIRSILQTDASVGSQRGQVHRRTIAGVELPIVVSYHPAYLLRNPADKRKSWEDLLRLDAVLEATRDRARETAGAPSAERPR